jgi:hypothetical protein
MPLFLIANERVTTAGTDLIIIGCIDEVMNGNSKTETMNTIKKEEYTKLNRALYELEHLLECMGIKEFSLSREKHGMRIDTGADNIDTDLLYSFCKNISQIYVSKFGDKGHRLPGAA